MAEKKITQLTELTDISDDDFLAVVDVSATVTKKIRKDNLFSGFLPTGAMMQFAGTSEPDGWLFCNGQAVNRDSFPALFTAIGTTYGEGDGSTTFNLPDFRSRVPVGFNASETEFNELGKSGGAKSVALTTAQMPSHSHSCGAAGNHSHSTSTVGNHAHDGSASGHSGLINYLPGGNGNLNIQPGGNNRGVGAVTGGGGAHNHSTNTTGNHTHSIGSAGSGQAHNNLQPFLTVNCIIKF